MITIIGMGAGAPENLSIQAREALGQAAVIIGSRRLIEAIAKDLFSDAELSQTDESIQEINASLSQTNNAIPQTSEAGKKILADAPVFVEAWKAADIMSVIENFSNQPIAVLFSGDVMLYSGAAKLCAALDEAGETYEILPGISSVQLMAAALKEGWENWRIVSAHGRNISLEKELVKAGDILFLTGGKWTAQAICKELFSIGYGALRVSVGEMLGTKDEKIYNGTVQEMTERDFSSLCVLLVRTGSGAAEDRVPISGTAVEAGRGSIDGGGAEAGRMAISGTAAEYSTSFGLIPDSAFIRGDVPMTKQEVRAAVLLYAAPQKNEIIWDVGSGTGSVAVALQKASGACVYAIEKDITACGLIRQNKARFGAEGLYLIEGEAPEACKGLAAPDLVFVGGSTGRLAEILDLAVAKNPACRIILTAIVTETLLEAQLWMKAHDRTYELVQIAVTRTNDIGKRHMLKAQIPVWILCSL